MKKLLTVEELIKELEKVKDKSKMVEIPEHGTYEQYCDVAFLEETKDSIRLVG